MPYGSAKRPCDYCGQPFRPRVDAQRYCRAYCRAEAKAAEGRAARRVWWQAGRPMPVERPQEQEALP
jgi:hypothetical protein